MSVLAVQNPKLNPMTDRSSKILRGWILQRRSKRPCMGVCPGMAGRYIAGTSNGGNGVNVRLRAT